MLPPNCWNPEASGSQTGPPSQESGGGPDQSQSQMALALTQAGQTAVTQSPPPPCFTWDKACGLGVWEMPRIFPPICSRMRASPVPTLDLSVAA